MAATQLNSDGIGEVRRNDLDITTIGEAVIRKVIAGTNVTISSTGVDAGTGDVTINAGVVGTTVSNRIIYNQTYSATNTFTLAATPTKIYEVRVYNNNNPMNSPIAAYSWTQGTNTVTISDTLQSGDVVYFDVELATLTQSQVNFNRIISSISSTTTAGSTAYTDYIYLCTGTFTLTIPINTTNRYTIKNISTGVITVVPSSGLIEGAANALLNASNSIDVVGNLTNLYII